MVILKRRNSVKHYMNLDIVPFNRIKEGKKTIELRLNDAKRSQLKVKDLIEFTSRQDLERINVEVIELHRYNNFDELYKHFDKVSMGYDAEEKADPKDMEKYYSKEEQLQYGVVAIEIKVIEDRK